MIPREMAVAAGKAAYKKYMQFLSDPEVLPGFSNKQDVLKLERVSEKFWQKLGEAALTAALSSQWRTIDSARKDGRPMWLSDGFFMRIGFWDIGNDRWVDQARAEAKGPCDLLFTPVYCADLPPPPVTQERG